jgi:hypothetical protein
VNNSFGRRDNLQHIASVWMISIYVLLTPILVLSTPIGFFGATELLCFFGILTLISFKTIRLSTVSILYCVFLVYFIIVNMITALVKPVNGDLFLVLRLVTSFLPFLLFDQITNYSEKNLLLFLRLFLTGLSIAVIAGLVMFIFGIELRDGQQKLWYDGGSMARAGGLTGNSGGFGYVSALFTSYLWIDRSVSKKPMNIIAFYILIFVGLAGIILSSSRAGLLFLIVVFAVLLIVKIIFLDRSLIKIFFQSLIIVLLVAWVLSLGLQLDNELAFFLSRSLERLDILNLYGQDAYFQSVRFTNWPIIITEIQNNWFIGLGYKQFASNFEIYSDNSFIGIAIDGGVFALFFYALFWVFCILEAIYKMLYTDIFYKYLIAFLMGTLAFSLACDFYSMWYPSALFFMAYGMLRIALYLIVVARIR